MDEDNGSTEMTEWYYEITLNMMKHWKYRMNSKAWRDFRVKYEGQLPDSMFIDDHGKTYNQFDAEREAKHIYFWYDEKNYPDIPLNPGQFVYFNRPDELIYPLCNDKQRAYLRKVIMQLAYPVKDFEKYDCTF